MTANILLLVLPVVVSGYVLYGAMVFARFWPEPAPHHRYFRILLSGYLWIFLVSPIFMPYVNVDIIFLENKFAFATPEIKDMENLYKTLLAIGIRIFLDVTYKLLRKIKYIDKDYYQGWLKYKLMERSLYNCSKSLQLVVVNLKNDKVYIGFILDFDLPDVNWIVIAPLESGYRDETKTLKRTIDYSRAIERMIVNLNKSGESFTDESFTKVDLSILIPRAEIVSLQNYNPNLYDVINTDKS